MWSLRAESYEELLETDDAGDMLRSFLVCVTIVLHIYTRFCDIFLIILALIQSGMEPAKSTEITC